MTLRRQVFFHLAVITSVAVLAFTGMASVFLLRWHRSQITASEMQRLTILTGHLRRLLLWDDRGRVSHLLASCIQEDPFRSYAFVEAGGRPLAWTFPGGVPRALLEERSGGRDAGPGPRTFRDREGRVFIDLAAPVPATGAMFHVGLDRAAMDRSARPLLARIGLLGIAFLLLGLVAAEAAARRASREVTTLVRAVRSAMDDPGSAPLPRAGAAAEVETLVSLFNRMTEERRRAAAQVASQARFLDSLLEALTHSFYVVDVNDYSIVVANRAAREQGITGGTRCFEVTHGRTAPCGETGCPCPLETVRASREAATVEHEHTLADGTTRFVEIHAYPILDSEGEVVQMIEYSLDITERKEAERALQESRARYERLYTMSRLMTDNLPDMVWAKDLQGRYLFANRALCEMLLQAADPEEAIGKTDTFFAERERAAHPGNPAWHTFGEICADSDAIVLERKAPGQFDESGNVRGRFLCLDVRKAPFFDEDGRIIGTVGSARDVTWQRAMEAEHRRLQEAIEQADVAVDITEADGTVLYVNPAYELMTGHSPNEAIGRGSDFLRAQYEDPTVFDDVEQTTAAGEVWRGRCRKKRKDGTVYVQEQTVAPVRDADGNITSFVSFQRDVTSEVELEARYLQAQKLESVGRLAGGIAHDFNNLLGAIRAYAELLHLKLEPDGKRQEEVDEILSATDHGALLTRQLLAFARRQPTTPQPLSLNEIASRMHGMLAQLIGEDVALITRFEDHLPLVLADPAQMEQVLVNLVVNARDAMPSGGTLTIETRSVKITAQAPGGPPPGRWVMLAVADTGEGMSREVQEHLFEPFFTTKEPGKGTGLGLATCFGIVTQAGGHLAVDSRPGDGTTMTVYLPEAGLHQASPVEAPDTETLPGGTETILFVEDEDQLRRAVAKALRTLGYTVMEAGDGARAMELWRGHAHTIDLVLTDEVMPGVAGSELARTLRRERPGLKVILISGYLDPSSRESEPLSPDDAIAHKPFSLQTIATLIRKVLDS